MSTPFKVFNQKDADPALPASTLKKEELVLPGHRKATALFPAATDTAEHVVNELELPAYKAVFLNLGGSSYFDDKLLPSLVQLFSRGIATAALEADALIVDGGRQQGVMALMGKAVADRGHKTTLIGISPANQVKYPGGSTLGIALDPHHSHFVLTEEDGTYGADLTFSTITNLLINRKEVNASATIIRKVPAVAIVTGGDDLTKEQVLQAVRQEINIIVIAGSTGLADQIALALNDPANPPTDPALAEIVADGKLFVQSITDPIPKIKKDILSNLGVDNVLMQAWETFADYDYNATEQQRRFDKLQKCIMIIGAAGTFLAIVQHLLKESSPTPGVLGFTTFTYYLLVIIPISLSVLITMANRFKQGNKWLLLRAAAESIKREIFRYRSRTNDYTESKDNRVLPAQQLSKKIEVITTRTMRTEVNSTYIIPYDKSRGFPPAMYGTQNPDDGFTTLSPDRYITVRLGDQLSFFKRRSVKLGKQLSVLSITSFIVGGIGTFLAAINQPLWIALTTTIVASIATYLAYRQTENTLTKYNQTVTNLTNVKAWWMALSPKEQLLQENINTLVDHTEQVLQVELDGWIQQMQNALAELRKNQETRTESEEETVGESFTPEEKANKEKESEMQAEQVKTDEATAPVAPPDAGEAAAAPELQTENEEPVVSQVEETASTESTTPPEDEQPDPPVGIEEETLPAPEIIEAPGTEEAIVPVEAPATPEPKVPVVDFTNFDEEPAPSSEPEPQVQTKKEKVVFASSAPVVIQPEARTSTEPTPPAEKIVQPTLFDHRS